MVSARFANRIRSRISVVGEVVAKTGLSPNALTVIGLLFNVGVAAVIATGNLLWGGLLLILAGLFDVVDGAVARATGQVSKFGAFFDSTLDRYADAVVLGGLLIYISNEDLGTTAALLAFTTLVGSLMISYTRSKAESLGIRGDVGFAQRAERIAILSAALIFDEPVWGLWILAIVTQATVVQRVYHAWRELRPSSAPE
jgi:CDP-diacylglycerol--glycerol-3-phosphate 3-phosphatidyltransferase